MSFARINIDQAKTLIRDRQANVVDIRDRASFDAGHIENAIHLDNETVSEFVSTADHSTPLVVCCYHGNMSQGAANYFGEQGFAEAYSLDGGYALWQQQGGG
ncbi:MAG: thiosulfate sulfurtransferase GlpE [Gammaproteobacteria bacterium]|nr:thiosulfate sulfurtransferase GlpE [Gammaproteobacteria bacterium]